MKFLNKETKTIIETNNKARISKFKGYPDKFEVYKKEKADKKAGVKKEKADKKAE